MEEEISSQKEMIEQQRSEVLRLQDEYEKSRSPEPNEAEALQRQEDSDSDGPNEVGAVAQGRWLFLLLLSFCFIFTCFRLSCRRFCEINFFLSDVYMKFHFGVK